MGCNSRLKYTSCILAAQASSNIQGPKNTKKNEEPFSRSGTRSAELKLNLGICNSVALCLSALGTSWKMFYKELALSFRAYCFGISTTKFLPFAGNQMNIFIHCCIFVNELCQAQAVFAGVWLPSLCIG